MLPRYAKSRSTGTNVVELVAGLGLVMRKMAVDVLAPIIAARFGVQECDQGKHDEGAVHEQQRLSAAWRFFLGGHARDRSAREMVA